MVVTKEMQYNYMGNEGVRESGPGFKYWRRSGVHARMKITSHYLSTSLENIDVLISNIS